MLDEALTRRRASSIAEVVEIMTALESALSRNDGVWWFNRLYRRVTLAVRGAVTTTTFQDPAFLERLDVVFANQVLDSVEKGDVYSALRPEAWRPFRMPSQPRHPGDAVALAGMNAHMTGSSGGVRRRTALQVVRPRLGGVRHRDFTPVQWPAEAVEGTSGASFDRPRRAGRCRRRLTETVIAMWKVRGERDTAWTNAEVLWALQRRRRPLLPRRRFSSRLRTGPDGFRRAAALLLPDRGARVTAGCDGENREVRMPIIEGFEFFPLTFNRRRPARIRPGVRCSPRTSRLRASHRRLFIAHGFRNDVTTPRTSLRGLPHDV